MGFFLFKPLKELTVRRAFHPASLLTRVLVLQKM